MHFIATWLIKEYFCKAPFTRSVFHQKVYQSFCYKFLTKEILTKVPVYMIKVFDRIFWRRIQRKTKRTVYMNKVLHEKLCQSYLKLQEHILIGQFPSKSIKVLEKQDSVFLFRQSPSKSFKVFCQSFLCRFTRSKNFVKENF